jgi:hypothetical protein
VGGDLLLLSTVLSIKTHIFHFITGTKQGYAKIALKILKVIETLTNPSYRALNIIISALTVA